VLPAWSQSPCAGAPSSMLMHQCANGFYHSILEHLDFSTVKSVPAEDAWLFPCNLQHITRLPFSDACFLYTFTIMLHEDITGHSVWSKRSILRSFEAAGNTSVCLNRTLLPTMSARLGCIHGLSAAVSAGFLFEVWSRRFEGAPLHLRYCDNATKLSSPDFLWPCIEEAAALLAKADYQHEDIVYMYIMWLDPGLKHADKPYVRWCERFVDTKALAQLDSRDLMLTEEGRRWLACVAGAPYFKASQMWKADKTRTSVRMRLCEQFQQLPFLSVVGTTMTLEACNRSVRFGHLSYPGLTDTEEPNEADDYGVWRKQTPESWAEWRDASITDEKYGLWSLYPDDEVTA